MSSSVHTEDSQWKNPSNYSRKDKSLGLLCSNFLKLCDREGVDSIGLDNAADQLGVERRRIYDIVNILESVGVLSRKAKNQYRWNGYSAIPKAVDLLKKEGLKDHSTVSSTCHNSANVIACNHSDLKEKGECETSGSHKNDNRKEKSLMILAQNFVKLFHCTDVDLISLDKAASALLGDMHDPMAMKTKSRRLYDIANVFVSMELIEKIRSPDTGKPAFRWIAWKGNPGSPAATKSDDSTRRTFGADITNTIPKRCRADFSSDLMSNGQVKRLKVAKDEELKDKNQEISTEQLNEHDTKEFVFGPFGPASLPRSGVSGKEKLKQTQNWEELASKFRPQYQNKAASELFAHYVEAWELWQVEAANELHKQHEH
ncbi:E2F transcription factor-like E2FF isoform X2 [Lycium ferocissimum]|uniref:E2F transcription factor-like E2FF isoform X1 n=1 Tax=Lycium ferocissimum TaxID=112874 RepID=UPI002814B504|nr:E2F transcription factor-like E2FF isoform X1 [Lycium ferocissimum]XP_059294061.1 E2F transcription factor-like E2FF isoform X2 [Lycium ferocissimum]